MRRILALGFAGGSSFVTEDDRRFERDFLGEAPLMAASKNSRSLRLRNMDVGVLLVVMCWRGIHSVVMCSRVENLVVGVYITGPLERRDLNIGSTATRRGLHDIDGYIMNLGMITGHGHLYSSKDGGRDGGQRAEASRLPRLP